MEPSPGKASYPAAQPSSMEVRVNELFSNPPLCSSPPSPIIHVELQRPPVSQSPHPSHPLSLHPFLTPSVFCLSLMHCPSQGPSHVALLSHKAHQQLDLSFLAFLKSLYLFACLFGRGMPWPTCKVREFMGVCSLLLPSGSWR